MRRFVLVFATATLFLVAPAAVEAARGTSGDGAQAIGEAQVGSEAANDPIALRATADLRRFTRWLAAGRRSGMGMIGEVGWPGDPTTGGDPRWNHLAADWYREAESSGLWVAAWATGEFWAPSYKLLAYGGSGGAVDRANLQADVIEQQQAPHLRGINVAGAEFATPVDERVHGFSNANPGTYGRDYIYPSEATLAYLAGRGLTFVRLPVRWERLQPQLGRRLDPDETRRLLACIDRARAAGLEVVLDAHNYGAYYVHDRRRGRVSGERSGRATFGTRSSRTSGRASRGPSGPTRP